MRSDEVFGPCSSNDLAKVRGMVSVCERGGGCERGGRARGIANVKFSDDHNFCRHAYIVSLMCIVPKTST